jgi:hypothetical protein
MHISTVQGDLQITSPPRSVFNAFLSLLGRISGQAPILADEELPGRALKNEADHGGAFFFYNVRGDITVDNQIWVKNVARGNHGGALYVHNLGQPLPAAPRTVTFTSTLMGGNTAFFSGGALFFSDLNRASFTIRQNDIAPGTGREYVSNRRARKNAANFYSFIDNFADNDFAPLRGIAPKEGIFLVEGNRATNGKGGAVYLRNAMRVMIDGMSFADNEAQIGGTLYLGNLTDRIDISDTIIYGGKAARNAGAIYARGVMAPLRPRVFDIANSSIQACEVAGGFGVNGSAGIYMERMNTLAVATSNFFANKVTAARAGTVWAASLKFVTRVDPLPALDPAFAWNNPLNLNPVPPGRNWPVVGAALIPLYFRGPIEVRDNEVSGNAHPLTTAGIGVPNNILVAGANYFIHEPVGNVFVVSNNFVSNFAVPPLPPKIARPANNAAPNAVVIGQ